MARHADQYKPDFQQALLLARNKHTALPRFLSSRYEPNNIAEYCGMYALFGLFLLR